MIVRSSREASLPAFEADQAASLENAGSEKNVLELAEGSDSRGDILEEMLLADGAGVYCIQNCLIPFIVGRGGGGGGGGAFKEQSQCYCRAKRLLRRTGCCYRDGSIVTLHMQHQGSVQKKGTSEAWQITSSGKSESAFEVNLFSIAETTGREVYSPLEQAILLASAEQQRRTTAKDEMQPWQVAAFSDAVLQQGCTRYLLRRAAKLNRSFAHLGRLSPMYSFSGWVTLQVSSL